MNKQMTARFALVAIWDAARGAASRRSALSHKGAAITQSDFIRLANPS